MDVLGLDLGTNSIGWALVDSSNEKIRYQGVRIFQEGVGREKGNEISLAAKRTEFRARRRMLFRRRLRKIETLKVLIELKLCPSLSNQQLSDWKTKKIYPQSAEFRNWWLTNEQEGKNPYADRYKCVTQKLDLNDETDRYTLGRAMYHLSQRRGFLSNRLEQTKENEDGQVKTDIHKLSDEIQTSGCKYLGEYFFSIYGKEKIRTRYTSRIEHYLKEFEGICSKQELPKEWIYLLHRAIFYQRPLKSQKGAVAKCKFEPAKACAPISHPLFEEYRMWAFIRTIKIKTESDEIMRNLSDEEIQLIIPLFYRVKEYFDFNDIAKKIAGKKTIGFYKNAYDKSIKQVLFNYESDSTVTACITCAKLKNVFGEEWKHILKNNYTDKTTKCGEKDETDIIQDIWHVLFTFDSEIKLREFAQVKLGADIETADKFARISLKQGYASLSLKAIKKILFWLKAGLTYSHAMFMANIPYILPFEIWNNQRNQKIIINEISALVESYTNTKKRLEIINTIIKEAKDSNSTWGDSEILLDEYRKTIAQKLSQLYGTVEWSNKSQIKKDEETEVLFEKLQSQMIKNSNKGEFLRIPTLKDEIISFLSDQFDLTEHSLSKLYHPSEVTPFKPAKRNEQGIPELGSPRIPAIKNPVVMRAMFQLRTLINELLAQHIITEFTPIRVEMARELNDANKRRAIKLYQDGRKKKHEEYKKEISDLFLSQGITYEPNDTDILKYELWIEQDKKCIYTNKSIGICDFIGANPKFDIEHTIPQSVSFDNSMINKTICDSTFNRNTKRNMLPSELSNHDEILINIADWKEKIVGIEKNLKRVDLNVKNAASKEAKDKAIVRRHLIKMDLDYWKKKYNTFEIAEIKDSFKNSQLADTGSITRYTLFYLKSLFKRVDVLKGSATADLRRLWGVQSEFEAKSRDTHLHHAVDAIVLASTPRNIADILQQYYLEKEQNPGLRKTLSKPWPKFVEDIKISQSNLLVDHINRDNLLKQTKRKVRTRGNIVRNTSGAAKITQGDSARGALHQDSFYGAITVDKERVYVKRRFLSDLSISDIKNIIDPIVRQKVQDAVDKRGKDALKETIWMNEDKNIKITKVRCRTKYTNPIKLKKHRDVSTSKYKQYIYVVNDSNHKMFIFEDPSNNKTEKKTDRKFALLNNFNSVQLYGLKQSDVINQLRIENKTPENFEFKQEVIAGSKVLLWEKSPNEVFDCDLNELQDRYYIVVAFEQKTPKNKSGKINYYGKIYLKQAIEARSTSDLKVKNGPFIIKEKHIPYRMLYISQFNALVEGIDFRFNILGGIERIE